MQFTNLKKTLLLVIAVCSLAVGVQAQKTNATPTTPRQRPTPEQRVDRIAQDIGLTPAQKAQFLQIERDYSAKMEALRNEKKAARTAQRQAQRALLTPEQTVKFDALPQKNQGKKRGKTKSQ